jgi:hypothetical protein
LNESSVFVLLLLLFSSDSIFSKSVFKMDTTNLIYLTPEELENGLVNKTIDKFELEKLLTNNIHENENIDTLVQFFIQYIPGNRAMDEFIEQSNQNSYHLFSNISFSSSI